MASEDWSAPAPRARDTPEEEASSSMDAFGTYEQLDTCGPGDHSACCCYCCCFGSSSLSSASAAGSQARRLERRVVVRARRPLARRRRRRRRRRGGLVDSLVLICVGMTARSWHTDTKLWKRRDGDGDGETWACVGTLAGAHTEGLNDLAWSNDASFVATVSDDKTLKLWDVETSVAIATFQGHESYVFCVDLNLRNTLIATGSFDETVKLWDVRVANSLRTIAAHSEPVTSVSFNKRDGTVLATSSYDGLLRLWDTASAECLSTMFAEQATHIIATNGKSQKAPVHAPVSYATYSPNGEFVLASTHDSTLRLWRTSDAPCSCIREYTGHVSSRYCAAAAFHVTCDRRRDDKEAHAVVTGSEDGRVIVWNLNSAQVETEIAAHGDAVVALAPHPNRDVLATGGMTADPAVKLWRWTPPDRDAKRRRPDDPPAPP